MNMTEVIQSSSPNLNTGTGKKGEMTTVGGQFASLLDYLTKLPTTSSSPVSADLTALETKVETPLLPDWIQELVDQPDELLSLLKQPEVETLKQEPKKIASASRLADSNERYDQNERSSYEQLKTTITSYD